MKSGALLYLAFEIGALFVLGGIYYLFQRRKYIKQHGQTTQQFMDRIKATAPQAALPLSTIEFELNFIKKYKNEKSLQSYPNELHEIYSEYIDYIESISGPIL